MAVLRACQQRQWEEQVGVMLGNRERAPSRSALRGHSAVLGPSPPSIENEAEASTKAQTKVQIQEQLQGQVHPTLVQQPQ